MATKHRSRSPTPLWAYAYEIMPPQREDRLHTITTLLERENSEAKRGARTWAARVVVEEQVTHILVVSDSPDQNHDVNRRLEAELNELQAPFSISVPLAVAEPFSVDPGIHGA